jgi:poly(U)-specific endoribonuclease
MALGTVRFVSAAFAPKTGVVNGHKYKLEMHRSQNDLHMRTFFPIHVEAV